MKLCGQKSVVTTSDVRLIGVLLSETINLPVDDTGRRLIRYTKSEAVERGHCCNVGKGASLWQRQTESSNVSR